MFWPINHFYQSQKSGSADYDFRPQFRVLATASNVFFYKTSFCATTTTTEYMRWVCISKKVFSTCVDRVSDRDISYVVSYALPNIGRRISRSTMRFEMVNFSILYGGAGRRRKRREAGIKRLWYFPTYTTDRQCCLPGLLQFCDTIIDNRSRNKRRNLWVGRCVSSWWPWFPSRSSVLIYMYIYMYVHSLYEFCCRSYIQRECHSVLAKLHPITFYKGVRGSWAECHFFVLFLVYQLCLALW